MPGDQNSLRLQRPYAESMRQAVADEGNSSLFEPLYRRALRKAGQFIGLDDPAGSSMEAMGPNALGSVVITTAKRVAPRKAAKTLMDLLLGRSNRLSSPPPIAEREAIELQKNLRTKYGGSPAPSPPTEIRMSYNSSLQAPGRTMPRTERLREEYQKWQIARGRNPHKVNRAIIHSETPNSVAMPGAEDSLAYSKPMMHDGMRGLAKRTGSVQSAVKGAPIRIKTEQELSAMLNGPNEALRRGMLTSEEAKQLMLSNKAKIDEYFTHLKQIDKANYDAQIEARINKRFQDFTGK